MADEKNNAQQGEDAPQENQNIQDLDVKARQLRIKGGGKSMGKTASGLGGLSKKGLPGGQGFSPSDVMQGDEINQEMLQ